MAAIWIGVSLLAAQQILASPVSGQSTGADTEDLLAISPYLTGKVTVAKDHNSDNELESTDRCAPYYCAGTANSGNDAFVCGDRLLGPAKLPSCLPLTSIITTSTPYKRFGDLCPGKFLEVWTQAGRFRYPFADGFANDTSGVPIQGNLTLTAGMFVDRFGGPSGTFVSPAGSPYDQRALPPSNLNYNVSDPSQAPYSYHLYEVKKNFSAIGGPITPWFGQPGLGTQFKLRKSVEQLLKEKLLVEVKVKENCDSLRATEFGWSWTNRDGRLRLANGLDLE